MKVLRKFLDSQERHFGPGGKLHKFHALFEAGDTILFTPGYVTKAASHVRDGLDLKRMMTVVVLALVPAILMAMYNTGLQAFRAVAGGAELLDIWQTSAFQAMGMTPDPANILACFVYGALFFFPILIVTFAVGGSWEVLFAIVRKHEINEGFFVTGMLFPLILPATIPLWQVALGISFGVVLGKEIFGGTGMNILNPALTSRVFLFFAYPAQISGDLAWIPAQTGADGVSGATWLANAGESGMQALSDGITWMAAFLGTIPGSMGETSALACLIGAAILVITGIGSWRTMAGVVVGSLAISYLLNLMGSDTNPLLAMPFHWHVVLGGWAFGAIFMATDPVTASHTPKGQLIYGFGIGVLAILIRVVNPAYPEGMMLAILFMNLFAGLIDHFVIRANVRRRKARYAA